MQHTLRLTNPNIHSQEKGRIDANTAQTSCHLSNILQFM